MKAAVLFGTGLFVASQNIAAKKYNKNELSFFKHVCLLSQLFLARHGLNCSNGNLRAAGLCSGEFWTSNPIAGRSSFGRESGRAELLEPNSMQFFSVVRSVVAQVISPIAKWSPTRIPRLCATASNPTTSRACWVHLSIKDGCVSP